MSITIGYQYLVIVTHQNCVNNHDELDIVCRHYNAMFAVHDIESRCEARYSKCVAVFTVTAMYIRPILFTLNICSEPLLLGWKINHVTSSLLQKEPWGKLERNSCFMFYLSRLVPI